MTFAITPSVQSPSAWGTRRKIGQRLQPDTAQEIAASVAAAVPEYPAGEWKRFSAVGTGAADDSANIQSAIDAMGPTTSMHSGKCHGRVGAYRLDDTLLIDRKSGIFSGEGPGSANNLTGTCLVWNGDAGDPMLKITQSWGLCVRDMRFKGRSTTEPSAAIYIDTGTTSPAPTAMSFDHLWIGTFGSFDTDNAVQFEDGFVVDGASNIQGDQSKISHITVQGCVTSCIAFRNSQNVLWHIDTATLNLATYGIEVGARHIQARNIFCQTISGADYYLPVDATLTVEGFGSELGGKLVYAVDGFDVVFRRGYFRAATDNVSANGRILELSSVTGGSVTLEDMQFDPEAEYAGPTLKFYVRAARALIRLKNVSLPSEPDSFFDFTTQNSGDSRHVILENVVGPSGVVYNCNLYWVHGDYAPTYADEALGQQHRIVLKGSKTWDPAGIVDGAIDATTVTVAGARFGDFCEASFHEDIGASLLTAQVSAADTVRVVLLNTTGGTLNGASGTLRVRVTKF